MILIDSNIPMYLVGAPHPHKKRCATMARNALLGIVDQLLPMDRLVAERAKEIVLGHTRMSARDAVHLAVMEQRGIEQILTFDSGFDGFPGIKRLS